MDVQRLAAFSQGDSGGNPAGVVLCSALPEVAVMQGVAAEVGYSETVFAAPVADGVWRVRYFAPAAEIAFCGHATLALGAVLALEHGDGVFPLRLNDADITVEGASRDGVLRGALQSPPTRSAPASPELVAAALALFGFTGRYLDDRLPPAVTEAGARHLMLPLASRERLAAMRYELEGGRRLMAGAGVVTIGLLNAETPSLFHARHAFAAGGVYEDPATGAAAAALGGWLRDLGWPHGGAIEVRQGEDMGVPCRLHAEVADERGAGVRVSGEVRKLSPA